MRFILISLVLLSGCGTLEDIRRGAADGARAAILDMPPPKNPDPSGGTLWYGIGALAAYVVGSLGKGYIRGKLGNGREDKPTS